MISSDFESLVKLIADGKFRPFTETEAHWHKGFPENSLVCIEEGIIFILYADEYGLSASRYTSISETEMVWHQLIEGFWK